MALGMVMIVLPLESVCLSGLPVFGLVCAPVYPSVIHATPDHFRAENSQDIIGIQMACACTGTTLMPPLSGLIANHITPAVFPLYLALFTALLPVMTERINRMEKTRKQ